MKWIFPHYLHSINRCIRITKNLYNSCWKTKIVKQKCSSLLTCSNIFCSLLPVYCLSSELLWMNVVLCIMCSLSWQVLAMQFLFRWKVSRRTYRNLWAALWDKSIGLWITPIHRMLAQMMQMLIFNCKIEIYIYYATHLSCIVDVIATDKLNIFADSPNPISCKFCAVENCMPTIFCDLEFYCVDIFARISWILRLLCCADCWGIPRLYLWVD